MLHPIILNYVYFFFFFDLFFFIFFQVTDWFGLWIFICLNFVSYALEKIIHILTELNRSGYQYFYSCNSFLLFCWLFFLCIVSIECIHKRHHSLFPHKWWVLISGTNFSTYIRLCLLYKLDARGMYQYNKIWTSISHLGDGSVL